MEKVTSMFEKITSNLQKCKNWERVILIMEYYEHEPGVGYSAFCVNVNGLSIPIDATIDYDFDFLFEIIDWHNNISLERGSWNKAIFTLTNENKFTIEFFWDEKRHKEVYGK